MSRQAIIDLASSLARHGLTVLAGLIVQHGWANADQAQQLIGLVVALFAVVGSIAASHSKRVQIQQAAASAPADTVPLAAVGQIALEVLQSLKPPTAGYAVVPPPGYSDAPPSP